MPSNASQKRTTTMPLTDVELCSAALVKIGAAVITSFEDESAEADIAKRLYEPTLQGLITSHPWHFTLAQSELAALDEAPQAGFSPGFELPQDALRTVPARADSRDRVDLPRRGIPLVRRRQPHLPELPASSRYR